ncbi:MAG: tRNA-dihydrouridine synthase, partial [Pseudomonadota bacterium]
PAVSEIQSILLEHLEDLYGFYGTETGVRVARKHISWYTKGLSGSAAFRHQMNRLDSVAEQRSMVDDFFRHLGQRHEHLVYDTHTATDAEEMAA